MKMKLNKTKMTVIYKTLLLILVASATIFMGSCSEDEDAVNPSSTYGYIQLKLYKQGTKALLEGNPLNHLSDAKKIELSLLFNVRL